MKCACGNEAVTKIYDPRTHKYYLLCTSCEEDYECYPSELVLRGREPNELALVKYDDEDE